MEKAVSLKIIYVKLGLTIDYKMPICVNIGKFWCANVIQDSIPWSEPITTLAEKCREG